jgi:hypothetical protein
MTDPEAEGHDEDAVDRFVKAYLDEVIEQTDATRLESRIRAGLPPLAPLEGATTRPGPAAGRPAPARRWSGSLGWSVAAATIVVAAFLGGRHFNPAAANAATILRQARVAHAGGIDRCYRVHFEPDPRYWDRTKVLDGPSESVLWTRGDRFWSDCSIGNIRLAIGREEDGTIWVSPSRRKGIRFAGGDSQLPREVAVLCDVNSLTAPTLMDDVLVDFNLDVEGPTTPVPARGATSVVWARLKPGRSHPLISTALMEIDARSGTLIRLVLWTVREGQPKGTVTYTLIDSATQGDDVYRLDFHLDPDAEVELQRFGRDRADAPKARN